MFLCVCNVCVCDKYRGLECLVVNVLKSNLSCLGRTPELGTILWDQLNCPQCIYISFQEEKKNQEEFLL